MKHTYRQEQYLNTGVFCKIIIKVPVYVYDFTFTCILGTYMSIYKLVRISLICRFILILEYSYVHNLCCNAYLFLCICICRILEDLSK